MKTRHYLSASLLALSAASFLSATEVVRLVGSTAFRSVVASAEVTTLSHVGPNLPGGVAQIAYDGANFGGASASLVYGYLADGVTEVYFINNFTGSAAGVVDLTSGNTTLKFIPTTVSKSVSPGTHVVAGTDYTAVTSAPSVAMSDVAAGEIASSISSQGTAGRNFGAGISASTLVDGGTSPGPVAVCNFQWVLGGLAAGNSAPFTNLTQNQAASLVSNGAVRLSVITGSPADSANFVFLVGRNEDSGTRIITFADGQTAPQFGSSAQQWMLKQDALTYPANNAYPSLAAGTSVTGLKLWPKSWPVNTIPTLNWNSKGHSGYNGGGDVVAIMTTANPVTGFTTSVNTDLPAGWVDGTSKAYFVSCLGTSDAAKILSGVAAPGTAGTALTYNGIAYSKANVQAGLYSLWGYEHIYYLSSATGTQVAIGTGAPAANALADTLDGLSSASIGAAGQDVASMGAIRAATGGPIN